MENKFEFKVEKLPISEILSENVKDNCAGITVDIGEMWIKTVIPKSFQKINESRRKTIDDCKYVLNISNHDKIKSSALQSLISLDITYELVEAYIYIFNNYNKDCEVGNLFKIIPYDNHEFYMLIIEK